MAPQTKSFAILSTIALVGTAVSVLLYGQISSLDYSSLGPDDYRLITYQQRSPNMIVKDAEASETVDTTAWKDYSNSDFGFGFKYKPEWKILPPKQKGEFNVIEIDPGKKFYNIKIYVSKQGYYVMDGLPTKNETINGIETLNVNDLLYGMKNGDYYYTFDIGLSLSLKKDFDALVRTVYFAK